MTSVDFRLRQLAKECGKRICSSCKEVKEETDFYKTENRCKPCCIKRSAIHQRRSKRGWTQEEYDAAVIAQEGKCAICKMEAELVADHCHTTQKKRKLLCGNCNLMLGHAKDSPSVLRAAAEYLEIASE